MLILHGNNLVASRQALLDKKKNLENSHVEIVSLNGKSLDLTSLKQAVESLSLFGKNRLVTIENLFSLKNSKKKDGLLNYLKNVDKKEPIIVWEGKQIDGRTLRSFAGKAVIQIFNVSPIIFKFIDSIGGHKATSLDLFHQTLKNEPVELVFYLLARRVSQLIIVKDLGKDGLKKAAYWQQSRLRYQAERLTLNRLIKIYKILLVIDYQQKTGKTVLTLADQLDLLLASL